MTHAIREQAQWKIYLLWFAVLFIFACLMLIVAPGRGAAWIEDDALFLRMSWDAANGYGLDRMQPQSAAYLVHALLMKFGLSEFLHFRYLNYILLLLSALVFFLGIDKRRFRSPVVPIAICFSILVSLDSILGPKPFAMVFFLFGAGAYFFSIDASQRTRHLLHFLSGVLFALAGFMHAAVVVAMILIIAILWVMDPAIRRSPLMPSFVLLTLLLWGFYISSVGMSSMLTAPAGHDSSLHELLHRIWLILKFYLKAAILYLLALYFYRKLGNNKHAAAQTNLSLLVTLFCIASLISYLVESQHEFPGWLWVSQLPGAIFYLLYFAVFRWLGEISLHNDTPQPLNARGLQFIAGIKIRLNLFGLAMRRMWGAIKGDALSRMHIVAVSGFILIPAAVAVGSNTAIIQGMVHFAGPAAGLLIILWESLGKGNLSRRAKMIIAIWLVILGTIALTYNHPTSQPVISANRVTLDISPLRGISETPRYAAVLNKLVETYSANGCRNKLLLALDNIPLIYYILQHPAPNSFGVVRPQMYFPEEKIKQNLDLQRGWCVLDATGIETQNGINQSKMDNRAALRRWLEEHSDRVVEIQAPSSEIIGDMHFLVRDSR